MQCFLAACFRSEPHVGERTWFPFVLQFFFQQHGALFHQPLHHRQGIFQPQQFAGLRHREHLALQQCFDQVRSAFVLGSSLRCCGVRDQPRLAAQGKLCGQCSDHYFTHAAQVVLGNAIPQRKLHFSNDRCGVQRG